MNNDTTQPAQNEMQIRQLVENWALAVRNRDLENILKFHSDNMVMYDVPMPFQATGIDAYRETWNTFFAYTKPGVFNINQLTVFADSNIAFCYATMKCADKSNSVDYVELPFRLTIGLQKINNQWDDRSRTSFNTQRIGNNEKNKL